MKHFTNTLIVFVCIILCFILQSSVLSHMKIAGVSPNLMLILVASLGFQTGERAGLAIGLFSGLLTDIFFGPLIGFYGLVYALIGFLCGKLKRLLYAEDVLFPILLVAGSDFLYGILDFIFLFLLRNRLIFKDFFLQFLLPEMIYTICLSVIFYPLFALLYDKVLRQKRQVMLDSGGRDLLIHK